MRPLDWRMRARTCTILRCRFRPASAWPLARERGDFTLPEAVAALTSVQADIYGIPNRVVWRRDIRRFNHVRQSDRRPRLENPSLRFARWRLTLGPKRKDFRAWVNGARVVDEQGLIASDHRPATYFENLQPKVLYFTLRERSATRVNAPLITCQNAPANHSTAGGDAGRIQL